MYTNSNRHRMGARRIKLDRLKEGDDILYTETNSVTGQDMIGSGTVFRIEEKYIIVQTGNGARGLERINKSHVLFK